MFGGSSSPKVKEKTDPLADSPNNSNGVETTTSEPEKSASATTYEPPKPGNEKRNQNGDKRRRSSVKRAADFFASAKNSLHLSGSRDSQKEQVPQTQIQALAKMDPALNVPQGSLNNSAGESLPTSRSTFRVGVTEDKNKKCRRTMEDTHAYLYHFLGTPVSSDQPESSSQGNQSDESGGVTSVSDNSTEIVETDNGYFAIFDGHAGAFAAEWCGKKLHLILEDAIRSNPDTPIPVLLDQSFTFADQQLEQLPVRNSGCTAVAAVLRWEDRPANPGAATADVASAKRESSDKQSESIGSPDNTIAKTPSSDSETQKPSSAGEQSLVRQRLLYTANVGDARIILCRNGKALRLTYDHKGSDENEGARIANAGGLILNNRVNGVLAVTRALGDSYMKDLVTGHPFTTETTIQPDADEFLILACDGLWDVCSDQEAVDLVRDVHDPQEASKILVDHALSRFSTDNLSCMIVRFDKKPPIDGINDDSTVTPKNNAAPVASQTGVSEATRIVEAAKKDLERQEQEPSDRGGSPMDIDTDTISPGAVKALAQDSGPEITPPADSSNTVKGSASKLRKPASTEEKKG